MKSTWNKKNTARKKFRVKTLSVDIDAVTEALSANRNGEDKVVHIPPELQQGTRNGEINHNIRTRDGFINGSTLDPEDLFDEDGNLVDEVDVYGRTYKVAPKQ